MPSSLYARMVTDKNYTLMNLLVYGEQIEPSLNFIGQCTTSKLYKAHVVYFLYIVSVQIDFCSVCSYCLAL